MATTPPLSDESSSATGGAPLDAQHNDPFNSVSPAHYRFSIFNADLSALTPGASPTQVRLALEAHIAETDRRMEEAGKLGTALVQQRGELAEQLKVVEKLEADGELSDDLRQKLIEIERDYNEVAQKSARAFLPKPRVPSNETGAVSPYMPESKGGMRSVSPSKFETQASASPSKLNVPNRKARNQTTNRIHDIEFAAEISTSLIAQVRSLQGLLSEKDDELKDIRIENSKLEYEAEGFQQRLRVLDDSESRYKDENWNLETQIHDLMAKEREAADREKKLTQAINVLQAEKNASQQKIDEMKLSHSKLAEEHAVAIKHHDIELGTAKRSMAMGESERAAMQRKIDDLTGQNQELAKAVSASIRGRKLERESIKNISDEDFHTAHDNTTPEPSPPPSPTKLTPRHAMLETETLKTSLAHAQRTIQSLRTNVHREKTERLETRRLLQEARDEIERFRNDPLPPPPRRARKIESKEFKKPPRLLGGLRSARSEIFVEDPDWEDQPEAQAPSLSSSVSRETSMFNPAPELSDHFQTANETSDATFETANEIITETEFHTGVEEFSSDDAETETDTPSKRRAPMGAPPNLFSLHRHASIDSTASTEDEGFYYNDSRPSTALPPLQAKFPLRVNRSAFRRSRRASEEPLFPGSPKSFTNDSDIGTPQKPAQSLAAELGDFDGSDNESNMSATPSRRSIKYRAMTPPPRMPRLARVVMVDSGMVTEPLHQISHEELTLSPLHSHDSKPLPEPDMHAAKMAALFTDHEEQLKKLSNNNALAHAAAVESLRLQHVDELATAKHAFAQELETIRSGHAENTSRAIADIRASYIEEIGAIKSKHADEISKTTVNAQSLHDKELESLKLLHTQQLTQMQMENTAAHAAEMEVLAMAHAEELSRKEFESRMAHDAQIEALKATQESELSRMEHELKAAAAAELELLESSHANALSRFQVENEAAHAAEIAALVEAHSIKIHSVQKELSETHAREFEELNSSHAHQIDQSKQAMESAYSEQLDALRASHLQHIDDLKASINASHAEELESLRVSHAHQIMDTKEEISGSYAATIASLTESHSQHLDDAKNSLHAVHVQEIAHIETAHAKQLEEFGRQKDAAHAAHNAAVAALVESHSKQLNEVTNSMSATRNQELEQLKASHVKQLEDLKLEKDTTHAQELERLNVFHLQQIADLEAAKDTTYTQEIERLKASHVRQLEDLEIAKDASHAAAAATIVESHSRELEIQRTQAEAIMSRDIAAIKDAHAQEMEALNNRHAAARAEELEGFKAALAKQIESSKAEGDAAHDEKIEALNAAHAKVIEAHIRDTDIALSRKSESYERELATLKSEHAAAMNKELELMNAKHLDKLKDLSAEHAAARAAELSNLKNEHLEELKTLSREHEASKSQQIDEIAINHLKELQALRQDLGATHSKELESLSTKHLKDLEDAKNEYDLTMALHLQELTNTHSQKLMELQQEGEQAKNKELAALEASHSQALDTLKRDHEADLSQKMQEAAEAHTRDLEALRQQNIVDRSHELATLEAQHHRDMESMRDDLEMGTQQQLSELNSVHGAALASIRAEHEATLEQALSSLRAEHMEALEAAKHEQDRNQSQVLEELALEHTRQVDSLKDESHATLARELEALNVQHAHILETYVQETTIEKDRLLASHAAELEEALKAAKSEQDVSQSQALEELGLEHARQLNSLKDESDATLARELETLKVQHTQILEKHIHESTIDKERLLASHAVELEALQTSSITAQPILGYSPISSILTEPVELPIVKNPRREAFMIPHDRQTLDSQQLFEQVTTIPDARPLPKPAIDMSHHSSQTTLTADDLNQLMGFRNQKSQNVATMNEGGAGTIPTSEAVPSTPMTVRIKRSSIESLGSMVHPMHRTPEPGTFVAPEPIPLRRPGSSTSVPSTQNRPPLPSNHREVIEAARTNSAHGGRGTMGPPLLPASAYRPSSRPQTPSSSKPAGSPGSVRGTLASRASRTPGYADVYSPTRMLMHSRQSSISSFASEIDSRFNMQSAMGMSGFGPSTDPRMIQAVTQTMIGEYLWKYTRKTGRGEMSEKRHRRFFWVHPYTRALYWSDSDPGAGSRGEMKAKSVAIEAVRVVADDNPMPPGLHRKSLVVIAPGRTIKFTCTTGQRHETWFNALSYLLLRSGNESKQDAEEVAGNITQEDIDEFNPSSGRRSANGQRPRPPPSLSSYNSRTTRNESPSIDAQIGIPTLTPTHERDGARSSTLGRLSGYWRSGRGTISSLRSRSRQPYDRAIYEASEVPDSAEDVRQILEQQDKESDRLENVRACCDGKHDVGTIPHTTKRGRLPNFPTHSHTHMHPALSSSQTAMHSTSAATT
ncbi:hypothetical protein GGS21DRAFT_545823 [Xylaria nigripes]|nr:hypothetical protein GGS21DRAFT_545823 [Xylaria nigripes]